MYRYWKLNIVEPLASEVDRNGVAAVRIMYFSKWCVSFSLHSLILQMLTKLILIKFPFARLSYSLERFSRKKKNYY